MVEACLDGEAADDDDMYGYACHEPPTVCSYREIKPVISRERAAGAAVCTGVVSFLPSTM